MEEKLSPMMLQWKSCKTVAKDAVLLFRLGDFYEAFYDDAQLISKELDLTLTQRQGIPMSGVPWHTAEGYIDQLVLKGFKVALAEQVEDPKASKGIVKREVRRFVTRATNLNPSYLSEKVNSFFACLTQVGDFFGLAFVDLTTNECYVTEIADIKSLVNELHRLHPAEILTSKKIEKKFTHLLNEIKLDLSCSITAIEDWHFEHKLAYDFLIKHFQLFNLDGLGLKAMTSAINALGALLNYLKETLSQSLEGLKKIQIYSSSQFMEIDRTTLKNLELIESLQEKSRKNTLLELLDKTVTPMGGRLLRRFIVQPLMDVSEINNRQNAIEALLKNPNLLNTLSERLALVKDLERLITRVIKSHASPKDLVFLKNSLEPLPLVKKDLEGLSAPLLRDCNENIKTLPDLYDLLSRALVEDPPFRLADGNLFRSGYNQELDELYSISQGSKSFIASYQEELRESSKIKTLKVGYTRISGFYIEVSKGQAEKVPLDFQRRQTLTNAERYITPQLKAYEEKVLQSEEKIAQKEQKLFIELLQKTAAHLNEILGTAEAIALVDVITALAKTARAQGYVRPMVDESDLLEIKEGRHPVIESALHTEKFVSNDTYLDSQNHKMMLITGPNMAGKSTYMRQVALIVILAQIGSYIPASHARVGLVDKVFSRIGASDDLARGQSTFMVEMSEAANILNNATSKSLVILDEIGRGTSTYDGISIAWSIAEYLLITPEKMAKTLFATHYFELTKLEEKVPGVNNFCMAVHESGDEVIFLRKIVKGKADRSYGIHVAKLAGIPIPVIYRSKEILAYLEENGKENAIFEPTPLKKGTPAKSKFISNEFQLTFFNY